MTMYFLMILSYKNLKNSCIFCAQIKKVDWADPGHGSGLGADEFRSQDLFHRAIKYEILLAVIIMVCVLCTDVVEIHPGGLLEKIYQASKMRERITNTCM